MRRPLKYFQFGEITSLWPLRFDEVLASELPSQVRVTVNGVNFITWPVDRLAELHLDGTMQAWSNELGSTRLNFIDPNIVENFGRAREFDSDGFTWAVIFSPSL